MLRMSQSWHYSAQWGDLTRSKRIYLTHYLHDSIEAAAVVDFCNSATWRSGRGDIFILPIVFFLESLFNFEIKRIMLWLEFLSFHLYLYILEPHWFGWYQNWDSPVLLTFKIWMVIKKDWWLFSIDCAVFLARRSTLAAHALGNW